MTESTARAERFNLQTSISPFHTWEVPQKPVSVRIPYGLIDRLENEAVENFRSLSSHGSEIGGLLVGSVSPGSPMIVSLSDYETIACDYSRGPLYRLSDADTERFDRTVQQHLAAGRVVAGFFRSHTRKGITLDADDLSFFEQRFGDPHHIVLLVRPYATKTSIAGIFIREGGKVNGDSSLLEFPFRSSKLAPMKREADHANEAPRPLAPSLVTPPAPKPAARAQIVPIASRRETALPIAPEAAELARAEAPPSKEAPAVAVSPAVVLPNPPATAQAKILEAAPVEEQVVQTEIAAKSDKATESSEGLDSIGKPTAAAKPDRTEETVPEMKPASGGNTMVKLLAGVAATAALLVGLFVYPGVLRHSIRPVPAPRQDSSLLQLHVERTAGELLLTWNRDAESIKTASKATLSISDGDQHENVEMDLAQLRNGSIVYSPSSADVSFKMEVTSQDNSTKSASESVRILRTRPSPFPDQTQSPASQNRPSVPVPSAHDATAAAQSLTPKEEPAAQSETKPATAPVAQKPSKEEPLAQRLRPASNTDPAETEK